MKNGSHKPDHQTRLCKVRALKLSEDHTIVCYSDLSSKTMKKGLGSNWHQRRPMCTRCVQDSENISSCEFYVCPVKLGKVMKYQATFFISIIYWETLHIEWGLIYPNGNRRVKPSEAVRLTSVLDCVTAIKDWTAVNYVQLNDNKLEVLLVHLMMLSRW